MQGHGQQTGWPVGQTWVFDVGFEEAITTQVLEPEKQQNSMAQ
jgi:hypothetical protein